MTAHQTRVKIESQNADAVQALVDHLLDIYEGVSSPLLRSQPNGWHAFINIKVEAQR